MNDIEQRDTLPEVLPPPDETEEEKQIRYQQYERRNIAEARARMAKHRLIHSYKRMRWAIRIELYKRHNDQLGAPTVEQIFGDKFGRDLI